MGKILLIEPYKILRQAISLSLFPEHEVLAQENIDAIASLKEYDLLIVDGAALRDSNRLTPALVRAIQSCKIPVLWLEDDDGSKPPKRENLLMVRKPIEREAFQSALSGLLSAQTAPKEKVTAPPGAPAGDGAIKRPARKRRAQGPQQATFQFIDLVDVVEEQPETKPGEKAPRKSK
jgi:hypothetical protein